MAMTVTGNHCYLQCARRSWEKLIHQVPKRFIRRSYLLALGGFGALLVGGPAVWAAPALTTLATFNQPNGVNPDGPLIADAAGNLYGTTYYGGASGFGTVFQVAAGTHTLSTLATFNSFNGSNPSAGLIADAAGNLYGTTQSGGLSNDGTVFQIAAGTHALSTLVAFSGSNGIAPQAGLIADSAGNLYGTTGGGGGAAGAGTVFEIAAGTHVLTTLATFNINNGNGPSGKLIADAAGNLYGTTFAGGTTGVGTVFEITAGTHALSTLSNFGTGYHPKAGLIADAAGNLYGTTEYGGAGGGGTLYEITAGTHVFSTLATFNGSNGNGPSGELIADAAGNLYGTTTNGGANNHGTVFQIAAGTNAISTLATFNGSNGATPQAGLIADAAGNLYGTTYEGGFVNYGTVFEITNSGFAAAVPEPAAVSLIGLAGLGLLARRRRSANG
ncbi:MAG: hypothetical protein JWL69_4742 [Phycisphaerales bacterium]|nr:hypothetical protein [Phycisphaerales bacterium]